MSNQENIVRKQEEDFYLHNLICYICTCYFFNNKKAGNKIVLAQIDKFIGHPLLNLLINVFIYNCFQSEYKISKNMYELDNIEESGGWSTVIIPKKWFVLESQFEYYEEEPLNIKKLYSEYFIKGYPFIIYQGVDISKTKEILKKDNFIKEYGSKYIVDHDTNKGMLISDYINNLNNEYFFHEGKDNMGINFSLDFYIPPEWYLLYNHHWGEMLLDENKKLVFEKSSVDKSKQEENDTKEIVLMPQLYIGGGGSGIFFETSPGFIDTLVYGKKRWFIYDPNMYILIHNSGLKTWDMECGNVEKWLDDNYENLNPKPHSCIQNHEETIYIPAGWNYMCINLIDSLGVRLNLGTHRIHIDNFFKTKKNEGCVPTDMTLN